MSLFVNFGKKKSVKVLLQYLIVSVADEEDLLPSVPEPKKRKMFQCPSCKPSISFSDEKKLVEHRDFSPINCFFLILKKQ